MIPDRRAGSITGSAVLFTSSHASLVGLDVDYLQFMKINGSRQLLFLRPLATVHYLLLLAISESYYKLRYPNRFIRELKWIISPNGHIHDHETGCTSGDDDVGPEGFADESSGTRVRE